MVISYMHPHGYWEQCWHQAHIPIGLIKDSPNVLYVFFFLEIAYIHSSVITCFYWRAMYDSLQQGSLFKEL